MKQIHLIFTKALLMALLTMTAQTAWADKALTSADFQIDNSIAEGIVGHYYLNMPTTGKNTLTLTAEDIAAGKGIFKVYDDGGKDGNYSSNCNGYLIITAPSGYKKNVTGTVIVTGDDFSEIGWYSSYLGRISSGPTYSDYHDISTPYDKFDAIRFYSDETGEAAGIDLNVVVYSTTAEYGVTVESATHGSVIASPTAAKPGDLVTLTATSDNNYILSGISVKDALNNTIEVSGGTWYNNTATFTMPITPVTVTPTFSNTLTGLSINMPKTGSQTVTIPNGVTSFKVYDDGGEGGSENSWNHANNYSKDCNGYLIITAPSGYRVSLTGRVATEKATGNEQRDYLTIYDGAYDGSGNIPDYLGSDEKIVSDGASYKNIGPLVGTTLSVTLYFHSNGTDTRAGVDLTASIVEAVSYGITINSATGGTVSASPSSAIGGDLVTLTATPTSAEYLLQNIEVTYGSNNKVAVSGGTWNNNTATFRMPTSAVTVTPVFTNNLTAEDGLFVNMPAQGHVTIDNFPSNLLSFKVYDDGGVSSNYSNICDGYLTLTAPNGYRLQLTGYVKAESGIDYLTVYDGADTSADNLGNERYGNTEGDGEDIGTLTSSGVSMTLYFHSSETNNWSGLNLKVLVVEATALNINCGSSTGNHIVANPAEALPGETVTLTAIHDADHILSGISVKDAINQDVVVNWHLYADEATFTMPSSAVTVTPTFSDVAINMPVSGTIAADIPGSVASFKVYDDGGKDGNHTSGCDGMLLLTAPENYIMEVSGTVTTKSDGTTYLAIMDGATTGSNSFPGAEALHSNTDNVEQNIGPYTTTGRNMLFRFCSTSSDTYPGLKLTVKLINTVADYNVNVSNTEGGSVTPDPTSGKLGDVINLTATPSTGYMLNGISVEDANQNAVTVTGGEWYSNNTASFSMPGSDVTVTPSFTNDWTANSLSAIIPKTGDKTITIPSGVQSFKVYDHGGTAGAYDAYCNGTLTLTAPDGYVLQLTGTIMTGSNSDDWLSVYNGANTSATPLLNQKTSDVVGMVLQTTDIGVIASSDNNMTLQFHSGPSISSFSTGLDLTVTLVSKTEEFAIVIPTVSNGSVSVESSVLTAKVNDLVTLNASPDEGYLLGMLRVVDANSNVIPTEWNVFENTATFTMPGSAVTVTPEFVSTNPLSINIPRYGTVRATIPAGITSLKVYDDGGASGSYSNGCNGQLILTAPAGYVLQIAGTMTTENDDVLRALNGTDNTGSSIFTKSPGTNGTPTTIDAKVSTGNSVLIRFESDSNPNNYAGLDLTVTLVPITYTISFNKNNDSATGTMDAQPHTYDTKLALTANSFEYTGYAFAGWATTADGEKAYDDQQSVSNLATTQGANVELFAKWTAIEYDITYELDGGSVETANPTTYTIESSAITLNNPTKVGYTFAGWTGTGLGAATETVTIAHGSTGNREYTATWYQNVTLTANSDTKEYSGVEQTVTGFTCSVDGLTFTGVSASGSGTNTGDYDVTFSGVTLNETKDETGKYVITATTNGKLTIKAKETNLGAATIVEDQNGKTLTLTNPAEGRTPQTVSILTAVEVDHVKIERTFTSGKASTVYLPFSIDVSKVSGGKFYKFTGVDETKTSWEVTYDEITTGEIKANTPYIFLPDGANDGKIVVNNGSDKITVGTGIASEQQKDLDGKWQFIGTYAPITWSSGRADLGKVYGFAAEDKTDNGKNIAAGQFVKVAAGASIASKRAYLKRTAASARMRGAADELPETMTVVLISAGGEATTIGTITLSYDTDEWYSLDGRKLSGKPTKKGLYIRNGKKIVVK